MAVVVAVVITDDVVISEVVVVVVFDEGVVAIVVVLKSCSNSSHRQWRVDRGKTPKSEVIAESTIALLFLLLFQDLDQARSKTIIRTRKRRKRQRTPRP